MSIAGIWRRGVKEARAYVRAPDRRAVRRALVREAFFRVAERFTPTVEAQWASGRYIVSTADRDVSRHAFVEGPYDLPMLRRAVRLIEEQGEGIAGRDVLEIGANIGTTTVPLLKLFGVAHVHAFEPESQNHRLLRMNIVANDLSERATARQEAVSDREGTLPFVATPRNSGSGHVARDVKDATYEVPCVTVDALLSRGIVSRDRLGLVWIDVEGHEAAVLSGAGSLPPVPIVVEYLTQFHSDLESFLTLIGEHSSRVFDLGSGLLIPHDGLRSISATDLLLMP